MTSTGNDEVEKMIDYFLLNLLRCIISNHQVMSTCSYFRIYVRINFYFSCIQQLSCTYFVFIFVFNCYAISKTSCW